MNAISTLEPVVSSETTNQNIAYIFAQSFDLQKVEEPGSVPPKYHLEVNGHVYYIGVYAYLILDQIKKGGSLGSILQALNDFHQQEGVFSKEEVSKAINQTIRQLFETKEKKASRVKSLFKVLNPDSIKAAIQPLSFLFASGTFKYLFSALIFINGLYYALIKTIVPAVVPIAHTSMQEGLTYILGIIACLLFHEIGHAVAAIATGITPKKIGFGIYFIFPAFYTDLTDVWRLNRQERIMINLGGIYFQLLINSFLIIWLFQVPSSGALSYYLQKIVMLNILVSIYNINPFFRFDGYWIYSDYFDIPNLRQNSNRLIGRFFFGIKNWITGGSFKQNFSEEKNYPLITYAILYVLFMGFVWCFIIQFIINTHIELYGIISNLDAFNVNEMTDWSKLIPLVLFASIPWIITFSRIYKRFKIKSHAI